MTRFTGGGDGLGARDCYHSTHIREALELEQELGQNSLDR